MRQILHKCAKTTHVIRAEIQRSEATIKQLSQRYPVNPKTILKWKHRTCIEDTPRGAKRICTVLSDQDDLRFSSKNGITLR